MQIKFKCRAFGVNYYRLIVPGVEERELRHRTDNDPSGSNDGLEIGETSYHCGVRPEPEVIEALNAQLKKEYEEYVEWHHRHLTVRDQPLQPEPQYALPNPTPGLAPAPTEQRSTE